MTRSKTRSYGMVTPPHIQPLLAAALRAFVWLVSNLGSMFRTIFNRRLRDWHTDAASEALSPTSTDQPEGTLSGPPGPRPAVDAQRRNATPHDHASNLILQDDRFAIPQDEANGCRRIYKSALMVSSAQSARPSNHEGGLTSLATRTSRPRLSSRNPHSACRNTRPQSDSAKWNPARALIPSLSRDAWPG
jgi:hypothetical protein